MNLKYFYTKYFTPFSRACRAKWLASTIRGRPVASGPSIWPALRWVSTIWRCIRTPRCRIGPATRRTNSWRASASSWRTLSRAPATAPRCWCGTRKRRRRNAARFDCTSTSCTRIAPVSGRWCESCWRWASARSVGWVLSRSWVATASRQW